MPQESPTPPADAVSTLPWTQADLGDVLEVGALQTLHDLDSRGADAFLREYLRMFQHTLGPALSAMDEHRAAKNGRGLAFEAHKLKSAAAQIGATRLSRQCQALVVWADRPESTWDESSLQPLLEEVRLQTQNLQETLARLVEN